MARDLISLNTLRKIVRGWNNAVQGVDQTQVRDTDWKESPAQGVTFIQGALEERATQLSVPAGLSEFHDWRC